MKTARRRFRVSVVVEMTIVCASEVEAAQKAEQRTQKMFDASARRLNAVAGADYGDVRELADGEDY